MKTSTKLGLVAVSVVLIASVLVTAVNAAEYNWEADECLGWYNHNRADFLVREGVMPGTFLTCDQDELDKQNELARINEIIKVKQEVDEDVGKDDDNDNERLDIKYCAGSGEWDGKKCIIEDPVEKAAYEDAVCDDPKDTDKYSSVCGGSYAVEEKPKHKDKEDSRQQNDDDKKDTKKEKATIVDDNKIFTVASEKYKELVKDIDNDEDDDDDNEEPKKSSKEATQEEEKAMDEAKDDDRDDDDNNDNEEGGSDDKDASD